MEERETRAVSLLERSRHELMTAQREHAVDSRDHPAGPGPGRVIISIEEYERRRAEAALVGDLTRRVEVLRGDLIRARAEADEGGCPLAKRRSSGEEASVFSR